MRVNKGWKNVNHAQTKATTYPAHLECRLHVCENAHELTCAEYLARRRPASQPLSHTRICLACSSSLFSRIRDSFASLIFLSLSARRRSISFRRFLLASVASRSFSFFATRRNSSSCGANRWSVIYAMLLTSVYMFVCSVCLYLLKASFGL